MAGSLTRKRTKARRALVQAVYSWQMSDADCSELEREFESNGSLKKADKEFFNQALRAIIFRSQDYDALFVPLLDRKIESLDKVELALLRLGTFELKDRVDVPYKVVINEWVEQAKIFGAEDSHKYINGILDRLTDTLRATEREA